jgi:hypothetical protein
MKRVTFFTLAQVQNDMSERLRTEDILVSRLGPD